jgi:hypothetical protein
MKKMIILVALAALAVPAFAQVTVEYDEFKRQTIVTLHAEPLDSAPSLLAIGSKEEVSKKPEEKNIILNFVSHSEDWEYLKCHELNALADGQPVELGESNHDGSVGEGYVVEYVGVTINLKTLMKLTKAKEVKFRLCNTVIALSSARHDALVKFLAALKGKKPE